MKIEIGEVYFERGKELVLMKVTYCDKSGRWTAFYRLPNGRPLVADDESCAKAMANLFYLVNCNE